MKGIPADLNPVVERLRNGAKLSDESKACGYSHNGPLREALRKLLGSDGYNQLMAGKRPVMVRQTEDGAPLPAAPVDDSSVPVVHSTAVSDGWKMRTLLDSTVVLIAPDGQQYVKARANEKATLVVDLSAKSPTVGVQRWRNAKSSEAWRPKRADENLATEASAVPEAAAPAKRTRRKATKSK